MDEFDRFQPDDWSRDGVTTVRRRLQRHFAKQPKENWIARTAKATIISIAVAALTPVTFAVPRSDLVQHAAFADTTEHVRPRSQLEDVEPGYWPKLIKYLDEFPRDETVKTTFDPDPFT